MAEQNKRQPGQSPSSRPRVSAGKRVTPQQQSAARTAKATHAKRAEQAGKAASRLGAAAAATKKTIKHAADATPRFDAGKALDSLKTQTAGSLESARKIKPNLNGSSSGQNRSARSNRAASASHRTSTGSKRAASGSSRASSGSGRAASGSSRAASGSAQGRRTPKTSVKSGSHTASKRTTRQSEQARKGAGIPKLSLPLPSKPQKASKPRGTSMSFNDNPFAQGYSANKKAGKQFKNPRGQQMLRGGNPSTGAFASGGRGGIVDSILGFVQGHVPIAAALLLVLVLVAGAGIDGMLNKDKVYAGVKVGSVDVSGMTEAEAKVAIDDAYSPALITKKLTVNVTPSASEQPAATEEQAESSESSEEGEQKEAPKTPSWTVTADKFDVSVPAAELAKGAFEIGREDGGALKRVSLFFGGKTIDPYLSMDNDKLEAFATKIDKKVGTPRSDATVTIDNGVATAVGGSDGVVVSRSELKSFINDSYLKSAEENPSITLTTESASSRTSIEQATNMATTINNAISDGLEFTYEGESWKLDAPTLGDWTKVSVLEDDRGVARLEAKLKASKLESSILKKVVSMGKAPSAAITFDVKGDQITVHTDGSGQIPMVAEATEALSGLYAADEKGNADSSKQPDGAQANDGVPVKVAVQAGPTPTEMSFEQAKLCGVAQKISYYKTEYEGGDDEAARVHNIHRASDLLNNSVVKANGGEWSFHNTAGECNKENGFEAAGVVVNGQIEQDYGGGICQVATTVFNAVYEAGLPVVRRHNHSLYVATYPDGRDAAVSWPDLDFIWSNDLNSDVLVTMGYTGGSVTCTLYGVDPHRKVSTKTGSWKKGQKYGVTNIVDKSIGADNWYTKNEGRNGSSITVWRTVKDASGKTIIEDTFESNYDPKDQVNVFGSQKLLNSYAKSTS